MNKFRVLFVCRDNIFESALAAFFCNMAIPSDREDSWVVASAGVEAPRQKKSQQIRMEAAEVQGVDFSHHVPVRITKEMVDRADLILAIDFDDGSAIWKLVPPAWSKVFSLREFIYYMRKIDRAPPVDSDPANRMLSKTSMVQSLRRQARSEHGFWAGRKLEDLNLPEPHTSAAATAWVNALRSLVGDVVTLMDGRVGSSPVSVGK